MRKTANAAGKTRSVRLQILTADAAKTAKQVVKWANWATQTMRKQQEEIRRLKNENRDLRAECLIPKDAHIGEFEFRKFNMPTGDILGMSMLEILPIPRRLTKAGQTVFGRVTNHIMQWEKNGNRSPTVAEFVFQRGPVAREPKWEGLLHYRGLGKLGLEMVAQSLNHYGITEQAARDHMTPK